MEKLTNEDFRDSFWDFKSRVPYVDTWPLMRYPYPVMTILATYFLLIAIGPRVMKDRPPMKLDRVMMIYNMAQVVCSATLIWNILGENVFQNGVLYAGCQYPQNTTDERVVMGTWCYFIFKITELLDTIFFILRKKNKQITFLHVYHHSIMVAYMWSYLKYAAGGDGVIQALLNCTVHVFMYTYYFLAGLGPQFHKYLWWKKYVTQIQVVQFVIMLSYNVCTFFSPRCNYNKSFLIFLSMNVAAFLTLFLKFYITSYNENKRKLKR